MASYALRPATKSDYDFLYSLKVACLKEYVSATWGWDEAFQQRHFAKQFDPAKVQIVAVDGRDVGQLSVENRDEELFLSGIYIFPGWQNEGLGTAIIRDVLSEAKDQNRPVALQVLKVNPARRLYERLGFEVVGETTTHYHLRYKK